MSSAGLQAFAFAAFPSDANPRTLAKQLVTHAIDASDQEPPAPSVTLAYRFGTGETRPLALSSLDGVVKSAWKIVASEATFELRTLPAGEAMKLLEKCAKLSKDLDKLAEKIAGVVEDADDEAAAVREMLGDKKTLTDVNEADRDVLRVTQLFAALVRGLQRAKKAETGLLAVMKILEE